MKTYCYAVALLILALLSAAQAEPDKRPVKPGTVLPHEFIGPGAVLPHEFIKPGTVQPHESIKPGAVLPHEFIKAGTVLPHEFIKAETVQPHRALKPIKLGAVLPLSGDLAYYGAAIRDGLILAQEHSAYPVELAIEDAPLLGNQILTAFEKLVKVEHVDAIAGNFSNQGMLLMSPGIERHQLPTFHTAAADEQILAASEWILTSNVRAADEAVALADYAFNSLGARRAAVLAVETSFGIGYRKAFITRFKELGGEIVADEMQQTTDLDVRSQCVRLRGADADVTFLATFGQYLGVAVRQLRNLGSKTPLLTVYEVEDPSVVAAAGKEALEGIRYLVSYTGNDAFERSYEERFGEKPQTFSRNAYDAARLLIDATVRCDFDRPCIREQLYRVRTRA